MRRISALLALTLLVSCGDSKDKKSSDHGLSLVSSQEKVIKSTHDYSFSEANDLSNYKCDEAFLENGVKYLDLVQVYTERVFKLNSIPAAAKTVVTNYNNLLIDLSDTLALWDESCEKTESLNVLEEDLQYTSSIKIRDLQTKSMNGLINTLVLNNEYKDALARVMDAAKRGVSPNFEDVMTLHLHQQTLYSFERRVYQNEVDSFKDTLESISLKVQAKDTSELGKFKVAYENVIEARLGKTIQYNRAYFSVPSKVLRGKTQCLGGTKTDLIFNYMVRGEKYYNKRPVVIFSKGHILPGQIVGVEGEFHLYGTETTASDEAQVYYGNIKDITALGEDILVADAFDYLYINAIQFYISDADSVRADLFNKVAKKYQIKNFKSHIDRILADNTDATNSIKGDLLAFGSSNTGPGTKSRNRITTLNKTNESYLTQAQLKKSLSKKVSQKSSKAKLLERIQTKLDGYSYLSVPVKTSEAYEVMDMYAGPHFLPEVEGTLPLQSIVAGTYFCTNGNTDEDFNLYVNHQSLVIEGKNEENKLVSMQAYQSYGVNQQGLEVYELQGYLSSAGVSLGVLLYDNNSYTDLYSMHTSFSIGMYVIPRAQGLSGYGARSNCEIR